MTLNKMLEWLRKTDVPLTTISKKTNVSRKTLYNWINGGVIRTRSYEKVYNVYKQDIDLFNTDIPMKGNSNMEAQYIIDLQREKIQRLESDLNKQKQQPLQNTVWDALEYDFYCECVLTFNGLKLGRTIKNLDKVSSFSSILGYTKNELVSFWNPDVYYSNFDEHPINQIITIKTKTEMQKKSISLPTLFEQLKDMIGNHYLPMPITYIHKDGHSVHTICYNKVDWKNREVYSKIQVLTD